MPTSLTKVFAVNDMVVHYRLRDRGVYEARYHKGGIYIEVSSKDVKVLKEKFIEKLTHYEESQKQKERDPNAKLFKEYAGRVGGGNLKYTFNNATEDGNKEIIPALKALLTNYTTDIVTIGKDD